MLLPSGGKSKEGPFEEHILNTWTLPHFQSLNRLCHAEEEPSAFVPRLLLLLLLLLLGRGRIDVQYNIREREREERDTYTLGWLIGIYVLKKINKKSDWWNVECFDECKSWWWRISFWGCRVSIYAPPLLDRWGEGGGFLFRPTTHSSKDLNNNKCKQYAGNIKNRKSKNRIERNRNGKKLILHQNEHQRWVKWV